MKVKLSCWLILLVGVLVSGSIQAYGYHGHKLIAQLAQQNLTAQTQNQVTKILGFSDMSKVASWADVYRTQQDRKSSNYTGHWHYVNADNINQLMEYHSGKVNDLYQAIHYAKNQLSSSRSSLSEQKQALKFLIHFVADAHQPLHVGKASDKGGNKIKIKFYNKKTNLHALWDSGLLKKRGLKNKDYLHHLTNLSNNVVLPANESIKAWFNDSLQLREQVYDFKGNNLGKGYYQRNIDDLELQLVKAGKRLAKILNETLVL